MMYSQITANLLGIELPDKYRFQYHNKYINKYTNETTQSDIIQHNANQ